MDDLIGPEHPARLIDRVLGGLELDGLTASAKAVQFGGGRPITSPQGIGSAREIARLTTNDDAFRFIVGDLRPSHDVIARFRVDYGAAFDKLLTLMAAVAFNLLSRSSPPEVRTDVASRHVGAHTTRTKPPRAPIAGSQHRSDPPFPHNLQRFLRADVPRHVLRAASDLVGGFAECCYEPYFSSAFQPLASLPPDAPLLSLLLACLPASRARLADGRSTVPLRPNQ